MASAAPKRPALTINIDSAEPAMWETTNAICSADMHEDWLTKEFCEAELENVRDLGHGAFGVVHLMKHASSKALYAVKNIHAEQTSEEEKAKAIREVMLLYASSECANKHIVMLYGVYFKPGFMCIG